MHRSLVVAMFALVTFSRTPTLHAQTSSPPASESPAPREPVGTSLAAADKAFDEEDWPAAVKHYQAAQRGGIDHALLHFRLGYSLHMLKRYDEALPHHRRAVRIAHPALRIDALYNAACALALTGDKPSALDFLAKARDAGFADLQQVNSDTDLDSLRNDATFNTIVESIDKEQGLFQQLDKLLGIWQITAGGDAGDGPRRTRTFTRPLVESHAIVSTFVFPRTGAQPVPRRDLTGLISPDAAARQWVWTLADGLGTTLVLRGEPVKDGGMRWTGRESTAAGDGAHVRWTLTPSADRLTELIENSEDGQTWRSEISRVYFKQPSPASEPFPDKR